MNHDIQTVKYEDRPPIRIEESLLRQAEEYPKGWGKEIWIVNNDKYCGKILEFNEGAEFSMHYHLLKHETFYVLEGVIEIRGFDLTDATEESAIISEGDIITIPPGQPHKIIAKTKARIIEFSTTHYEKDSYRIQKGDSQRAK